MQYAHYRAYPLQAHLIAWGMVIGGISLAWSWSTPLIGGALLVLLGAVGCVWRRGEPPILAFCLTYQWLFIITGYVYLQITDTYPGLIKLGRIEAAVGLSLLGFLALVAGIRIGGYALAPSRDIDAEPDVSLEPSYNTERLCLWVIGLYTINWFIHLVPMTILFDAAQLIVNLLALRGILFALLLFVVLQQQTKYRYAALAFLYVFIPQFASMMAHFKESLFLFVIALLAQWRPWSPSPAERHRSARIIWTIAGTAVILLIMAVLWEGGIKPRWRPAIMHGVVTGSPIQKLKAFAVIAQEASADLDIPLAAEALASRLSSGIGYFSRVLERVPEVVPYERGGLTRRALRHIVIPRFLFPEKLNLGGDSWLVWKYAGARVADEKQGTSVGLGYMAEFYIDFGVPGMFLPLFAYGLFIGLVYQSIHLVAPSSALFHSVITVIFLQHFTSYEGELAKLWGGLMQTWIMFLLFLYFCGPWVHRQLLEQGESVERLRAC
jgi:hypothetical protein